MPVFLSHSLCALNLHTSVTRQDVGRSLFPVHVQPSPGWHGSLCALNLHTFVTWRDVGRIPFPVFVQPSPGWHGILHRMRVKAFLEPDGMAPALINTQSTGQIQTLVPVEREPDDAEAGINGVPSPKGKRRSEVFGKDTDLEQDLDSLTKREHEPSRRRRRKFREPRLKLKDLQTMTAYMSSLASEPPNEVQLRLEGAATNFVEPDVVGSDEGQIVGTERQANGNVCDMKEGGGDPLTYVEALESFEENLEVGRRSHVNGSMHVLSKDVEDPLNGVEGLVPFKEQGSLALSELTVGGRLVADFTSAWDGLAGRLSPSSIPVTYAQKILTALKLAVSAVNRAADDVQLMLARSLAVAYTLADLQMVAVVMAAGLLHNVVEAGLVSIQLVEQELGSDVSRLLHDSMRFKRTVDQMDLLDEESARAVRHFCLSYHDLRSIIIGFSAHLHRMRHMHDLPRYEQHLLALEALNIHAPLAHAVGADEVSMELEDSAFKMILPDSYESLDYWFRSEWPNGSIILEECKQHLSDVLKEDEELNSLIEGFSISGRLKSRFSTMKKLLKDGRKHEGVYDIVGLRVVVSPLRSLDHLEVSKRGRQACYRVLDIARAAWREVPGRIKDYIAKPKPNGYESLHVAVYLAGSNLTLELQIRTSLMDFMANGGDASHSLYKGGMTDPEQVRQLKKLMMVVADQAALSLKELTLDTLLCNGQVEKDHVFLLFDKNRDGEISMAEFHQVMDELGLDHKEAHELMQLVDTNKDGSVSVEEFADFRKQVRLLRGFEGYDKHFSNRLGWKLRDSTSVDLDSRSLTCTTRPFKDGGIKTASAAQFGLENGSHDWSSEVALTTPQRDVYDVESPKQGSLEFKLDLSSKECARLDGLEAMKLERIESSSQHSTSTIASNGVNDIQSTNSFKKAMSLSRPTATPSVDHGDGEK